MAEILTTAAAEKNEVTVQKPKIKQVRIPLPGESYVLNNFYYCIYGSEVKWENDKVTTTAVLIREVSTGSTGTVLLEDFEKWASDKKRTDL
jgi:hypothetical protein